MPVTISRSHGRNGSANRMRATRLSLFLATAAIGCGFATGAGAQTLDLGGATVTLPDLDVAPGDQYDIVENGVLRLDPAPPLTFNGILQDGAGTLALEKLNNSNLILGGNNTYTGGTTVFGGTLTLGSNTAAGTGMITFSNGTTLATGTTNLVLANAIQLNGAVHIDPVFGIPRTVILDGNIGGTGSLNVSVNGRLILNGNNSYSGGTTITSSGLTVGSSTAAGTGTIRLIDGTLAAGVSGLSLDNAIEVTGLTNFSSGVGVFTLNGDISGAGTVRHIGTGNLVLNGNNSYTGGLGIYNGGTVTLGSNTAAGTALLFIADGTLAAGAPGLVITNDIVTFATNSRVSYGNSVFTLSGTISGAGSIETVPQSGGGYLLLKGNNSFTGGLGIGEGSAVALDNNNAAGTGTITFRGNGFLLANRSGLVLANAIVVNNSGRVYSGLGNLTLNGTISGAGSLVKVDSGNLVLNGNNSFAGGLDVAMGTVTLGNNSAAGTGTITLRDQATLAAGASGLVLDNNLLLDGSTTIQGASGGLTLRGTIAGTGSLTSTSLGILLLTGNNSFSGGLTIAGGISGIGTNTGVVTLGSNTAAGTGLITITDLRTLAAGTSGLMIANTIRTTGDANIDAGPGIFTVNGAISGPGAIVKTGTGNLVLNGNNSFTNGLSITAGRVTLGTNTAAGTGQLTLSGPGATLVAGASGLVLTNAIRTNSSGQIDSGSGTLTMNGAISGSGSITKTGSGTLVLGGAGSFTGPTSVSSGRLIVMGSLGPSAVTVFSAGTIGGTGTVASLNTMGGGVVAPGGVLPGSVGTLTVTGNATFQAGSTFQVDLSGGLADRLTVGGAAALNGANLTIAAGGQPLLFNTSYTILSAAGGRTGTFTTGPLTQFGPQFAPTLTYGTNDVVLKLVPNSLITLLGTSPLSSNVRNRAAAFDAATSAGFNPQDYFNVFGLGSAMGPAINQLTGEIHSIESRAAIVDTRHVRDAVFDRLGGRTGQSTGQADSGSAVDRGDHRYGIWGRAVGSWGDTSSDGNGARIDTDTKGLIAGFDVAFNDWTLGANFAALRTNVDTASLGNGKVESFGGGLYGGYRSDKGFGAAFGGSISSVTSSSVRVTSIPTITQTLSAKTDGIVYQGFGEISFDLAAAPNAQIEPFARFAYVSYHVDGVRESGGFAAVTGGRTTYETTVATAGLRGGTMIGGATTVHGSLAYQRTGGDRGATTLLSLSGTSSPAAISAVPLDKDAFAATLGVDFRIGGAATIGFGYSGVIGKNNSDHSANATLTIGF